MFAKTDIADILFVLHLLRSYNTDALSVFFVFFYKIRRCKFMESAVQIDIHGCTLIRLACKHDLYEETTLQFKKGFITESI